VAVAGGYPGPCRKGDPITVDEEALAKTGALLFAAGAQQGEAGLCTSGGRVLTVSAWGEDGREARTRAYKALEAVKFDDMAYRTDIGLEGNTD
jgi:phosphoribosylamine--glycine ligase